MNRVIDMHNYMAIFKILLMRILCYFCKTMWEKIVEIFLISLNVVVVAVVISIEKAIL